MDYSKDKIFDILSTCQLRHNAIDVCSCTNCKYNGKDCLQAHEYAQVAVRLLKVKEVQDARK